MASRKQFHDWKCEIISWKSCGLSEIFTYFRFGYGLSLWGAVIHYTQAHINTRVLFTMTFGLGRRNFNSISAVEVKLNLCIWIFVTIFLFNGKMNSGRTDLANISQNQMRKIKRINIFYDQNVNSLSFNLGHLCIKSHTSELQGLVF